MIGSKVMFSSVEQETIARLRQSSELLKLIKELEPEDETIDSDIFKIQKGYLFVSLYSSIEYVITHVVGRYLELLKHEPKKPMEYRRYILCSILNSNFSSIRDCSKKIIWDKKASLFDALFSDDLASIDESVFPTDGLNISYKQIQDIWKFFHLSGPELPNGVSYLLLKEIREHRNAIAHGREKAADIGGRYTPVTLSKKVKSIEKLCLHIIEAFNSSYSNEEFLVSVVA